MLLVDMGMKGSKIDVGGDGDGNDGMEMTLMGGVMREANVKGIGLCHKNGDGNVGNGGRVGDDGGDETVVGGAWDEMGVTVGGEMVIMGPEEEIEIK